MATQRLSDMATVQEVAMNNITRNVAISLFSCFAISLLAVGCAVGPDYSRPHVSIPTKWRDQQGMDSSIAGMSYWKLYNDPQLQEYIKAALDSNLTILASMARIKQAEAEITFTKADLYPNVGIGASGGAFQLSKNRYPGFSPDLLDGVRGAFGLGAILNWELDIFGRVRRATEAQRALLAASEAAQRAAIVSTVSSVAETYITLREFDRLKEILDTNLVARREYAKLAETLFKGGKTSELDFRQAEAELKRVEANVPVVNTAIAQTENALNVLIGRTPGTPVRRGTSLEGQSQPPTVPAGLPSSLIERRPDVVQAEQELVAANAEIGVATAQLFPRITLSGNAGWQSLSVDNLVSPSSFAFQAGGELLQPLFNAGKNIARVDAADARMQQLM